MAIGLAVVGLIFGLIAAVAGLLLGLSVFEGFLTFVATGMAVMLVAGGSIYLYDKVSTYVSRWKSGRH
jgi:hypothetical protein